MPGARALLLIVLAALLTVLAGPSAAAFATPSDPVAPSVTGIAPNGDDAAPRVSHPGTPVPDGPPGERNTPRTPGRAHATAPTALAVSSDDPATAQQDRAPPTG